MTARDSKSKPVSALCFSVLLAPTLLVAVHGASDTQNELVRTLVAYLVPLVVILFGMLLVLIGWISEDAPPPGSRRTKPPTVKIWVLEFPRPVLPARLRLALLLIGLVVILVGVIVFAFWRPALLITQPSLISLSYMADDWAPRTVDLRTVSSSGIPVSSGQSLRFFDLWIAVPEDAPEHMIKAEVYVGDERIGVTSPVLLVADTAHPGMRELGDVKLQEVSPDPVIWTVKDNWTYLDVVLAVERNGKAISSTRTRVRLDANGRAWLIGPPNANFAAMLTGLHYLIRGEVDPRMVDLRTASTSGIPVEAGQPLHFFDLWAWVPQDAPGDMIQVQVYAGEQEIGYTEGQPIVPGAMQLGDMIISSYVHDEFSNAWEIQGDWAELQVFLVTYSDEGEVGKSYITIRLDPEGTAWLWDPPNLSFSSIVYSINDGPQLVLDLRQSGNLGLDASHGDRVTLHEVWYHSNANSRDPRVELEAYLDSQGSDWSVHKYAVDDIYWGTNQLGDLPPLSWDVPADDDALVLLLSRIGEGGNVIMQALWLPFGVEDSPGLVPVSEAVLWPFEQAEYVDFESLDDLAEWRGVPPGTVAQTSAQAFTGNRALAVSTAGTSEDDWTFAAWEHDFQAEVVVGQVYWPRAADMGPKWAQVCVINTSACVSIPRKVDRWNTFVLDLSELTSNDEPLNALELRGLTIQGEVYGTSEQNQYSFYVDGIQLYPVQLP